MVPDKIKDGGWSRQVQIRARRALSGGLAFGLRRDDHAGRWTLFPGRLGDRTRATRELDGQRELLRQDP